jgi:hypothetical protein
MLGCQNRKLLDIEVIICNYSVTVFLRDSRGTFGFNSD